MKTIANIIHQNKLPLHILDNNCNIIYSEFESGFWSIKQFDSNDKRIYYENSAGTVDDQRP